MISVAVVKAEEAGKLPWDDLRPFARNAFMNPVALKAAADTMLAVIYVLVAWDTASEPVRMVGFWALQMKHLLAWPLLEALPFNYAFLSTPLLHPDYADEVMPAFLAAIARERALPNTVLARDLDAEGRENSALMAALASRPQVRLSEEERPIATREFGLRRSGSTRKKLRQTWNRLEREGKVAIENVRDPARIGEAFEAFLELEARSWKGDTGTALLSRTRDAAFGRRLVVDLAAHNQASVALLTLDGKPIATQVLIFSGAIAYTWKTSFDPACARFSPGSLLIDRLATDLLDNGEVELIDSCAGADGFMGQLLAGRKPMADIVFSASPKASLSFVAVSGLLRTREMLKGWRDRFRNRTTPRRASADSVPASRPIRPPENADPVPPGSPSPAPTVDRAA